MISLKRLFLLLAVLIGISGIFLQWGFQSKLTKPTWGSYSYIEAYVQNADILQSNNRGLPTIRLQSSLLTQYGDQNTTISIQEPLITLYLDQNQVPWIITANQAQTNLHLSKVELSNNVRIYQKGNLKKPETILLTDHLTLYPDDKKILTFEPVTLIRPGLQIQSLGAQADLKKNNIILSDKARAYYDTHRENRN